MPVKPLKGVFPLMPFVVDPDGALDLDGLRKNVASYEESGVDGFVAFGCMGECYASSYDEFCRVADTVMEARENLAVVLGVTYHNTAESVRRAEYAERVGADGIMSGTPYLIPCDEAAIVDHYRALEAALSQTRIMAYNNPFSFRVNFDRTVWDRLAELDGITAVKESNGETLHRAHIIPHIAERVNVFSGSEHWFLPDSLVGANSIVAIAGPGIPKTTLAFHKACLDRDMDRAAPMHAAYNDLVSDVTGENEVAWLKACAEFGGLKAGPPRAPYQGLDPDIQAKLEQKLMQLEAFIAV